MGSTRLSSTPTVHEDGAGDSILRLSGVNQRFSQRRKEIVALDGIDLEVRQGEFVVIVGASGCGKSTLLKLIAGLLDPTSGSITRGPALQTDRGIGMVFQRPVLLPWRSVMRNVLLPSELVDIASARATAADLIEQTGLQGFENAYPHQLSGGMQQRVAICRALLTDPALLLMDEPFGALDAITRERLNLQLQDLWARTNKTVILVTHSIEEAIFLADRIVVMSPRPGQIRDVIVNDLARPRGTSTFTSPQFAKLSVNIRSMIVGDTADDDTGG